MSSKYKSLTNICRYHKVLSLESVSTKNVPLQYMRLGKKCNSTKYTPLLKMCFYQICAFTKNVSPSNMYLHQKVSPPNICLQQKVPLLKSALKSLYQKVSPQKRRLYQKVPLLKTLLHHKCASTIIVSRLKLCRHSIRAEILIFWLSMITAKKLFC